MICRSAYWLYSSCVSMYGVVMSVSPIFVRMTYIPVSGWYSTLVVTLSGSFRSSDDDGIVSSP